MCLLSELVSIILNIPIGTKVNALRSTLQPSSGQPQGGNRNLDVISICSPADLDGSGAIDDSDRRTACQTPMTTYGGTPKPGVPVPLRASSFLFAAKSASDPS